MNITKQTRLKLARLLKLYSEVQTDNGMLIAEGELAVDTEVFIADENGDLQPAADGTYVSEDMTYTVVNGVITAIEEKVVEETIETEEPTTEEMTEEEEETTTEETTEEETTTDEPSVEDLQKQIEEKDAKIAELEAKVAELEEKLKEAEKPVEDPIEEEETVVESFASEVLKFRK